jgi:hypothetical protein
MLELETLNCGLDEFIATVKKNTGALASNRASAKHMLKNLEK